MNLAGRKIQKIADGTASDDGTAFHQVGDAIAAAVSGLAAIATSGSANDLIAGTVPTARIPAFSGGDVTSAGASLALMLAASGVSASTVGDASHVATVTVDVKGRVTVLAATAISLNASAVASGNLANARLPVATTDAVLFGRSGGGYDSDSVIAIDPTNHRLGVGTASPGWTLEVSGMSRHGGRTGINADPDGIAGVYFSTDVTASTDKIVHGIGGSATPLPNSSPLTSYVDWQTHTTDIANGATVAALFSHRFRVQSFDATSATITDAAPATVVIDGPPSFLGGMTTPANPRALRVKAGDISIDSGTVFAFQFQAGSTTINSSSADFQTNVGITGDLIVSATASVTQLLASGNLGVWGGGGFVSQPTVTGSKVSGAALISLLGTLAAYGLIIDGTSA